MIDMFQWLITHSEKVGIVVVLFTVIIGLVQILRLVHKQHQECAEDRLVDREALGEMRGDIKALEARLDGEKSVRQAHIDTLNTLHTKILEQVVLARGAK